MKVMRKILSRVLLVWALLVATFAVAMLFNEKEFTRKSALPAFLVFGAPALGSGAWLAWRLKQQEDREQAEYLQQVFYRLVLAGNGTVSAFQLAMEARVSGCDARAYLERCSREFDGEFEITDTGKLLYRFDGEVLCSSLSDSISSSIDGVDSVFTTLNHAQPQHFVRFSNKKALGSQKK